MNKLTLAEAAKIIHETLSHYKKENNNPIIINWDQASPEKKQSTIDGIKYHLLNPTASAKDSHDSWMNQKIANGWVYGETKDPIKKTHPKLVPYDKLDDNTKSLDHIFSGLVNSLRDHIDPITSDNQDTDTENSESQETEITIFGIIEDLSELNNLKDCDKEDHIQLEAKFNTNGKCRVRKTTKGNEVNYIFTIKTKTIANGSLSTNIEYSIPVDEAFFDGFFKIADIKLVKTRYNIVSENSNLAIKKKELDTSVIVEEASLPEILFELDVFTNSDGSLNKLCKIDIELDALFDYLEEKYPNLKKTDIKVSLAELPVTVTNSFIASQATDEQKKMLNSLFKGIFNHNVVVTK